MRYSLASLLVTIAVLAAGLGVYVPYGWLGVLLLVPHLLTLFGFWWLVKRRKWRIAGTIFFLYTTSWTATAYFGIPQVREDVRSQIWSRENNHRFGELKQVGHEPMMKWIDDGNSPRVKPPWSFVGNGWSPCPFVVTMDYGTFRGLTDGEGYKRLYVWCFGYRWHWYSKMLWLS
ncbi:MAG: hypothetical protein SFU86_14435 [Pirellulaceae bacterium]|nr:hypothetical protein [Pirellulaceae bacterium]